jgi:hypothetical protein
MERRGGECLARAQFRCLQFHYALLGLVFIANAHPLLTAAATARKAIESPRARPPWTSAREYWLLRLPRTALGARARRSTARCRVHVPW